jgi:hypothetical protein
MGRHILVNDPGGLFPVHAEALSDGGKNDVKYHTFYNYRYEDYAIGKGYGHLDKILYFFEWLDWADLVVDFDVRGNDLIGWIRDNFPEKSTFGSGWGCKLEDDRLMLKDFIKSFGLPIQPYVHVKGITNLREHLKKNPKKYVKLNIFREDMESFYAEDYDSIEMTLDQIADAFGPHKETYDFIVEDLIETDVEIGFDGFFNGVEFLKPYLIGYEIGKNLYIAKAVDELPPALEETRVAFTPLLQKLDYRGPISWEEKIISQKEHYILDWCSRLLHPGSLLYTEHIKNWADMVYQCGLRKNVRIEYSNNYVGAFCLKSSKAINQYIKVNIEDETKVKPNMVVGNKKGNYATKGEDHVAVVIASGDSVEEVLEQLHENAEGVEGDGIDKDPLKGIDDILDVIEEGEEVGIEF